MSSTPPWRHSGDKGDKDKKGGDKKRKVDPSGREFVIRERGSKRAKRARELALAVIEGSHQPKTHWSETKCAEFDRLREIQNRRRELDQLECEARERFLAATRADSRSARRAEEEPEQEEEQEEQEFAEVEVDPVEAASFLELETSAPETPAPASPTSPKRKGKGKKSAKPSRIAPSKAPAKASAKKPAVSTAPSAGTTATAAAVPAEVVGSAPEVPSPKAKVPVSEPADT